MLLQVVLALNIVGAGITQKELDALPKPDQFRAPLFSRPALAGVHASPRSLAARSSRTPTQIQILAAKARQRRVRTRNLDSFATYDPGVIYAQQATSAYRASIGWRYP